MKKIFHFIKEFFLDVYAGVSGFVYGFFVFGAIFIVLSTLFYFIVFIRNLIV